ncbi:MAG: hypothetical protein DRP84_08405 [Spirochaetes bacterium]|nr:MAG: hypothetical protein DRP84_08405 [Spirochaetota bacterium]
MRLLTNGILIIVLVINFSIANLAGDSCLEKNLSDNIEYKLLIIAPKEFIGCLQPLVHHKESIGIRTKIVSTCEIYKETDLCGRDNAEKIKYFIKKAIEEWKVEYVLLVGGKKHQSSKDKWWVPVRYSHIEDLRYKNFKEKKFLSDLYFADIYDKRGDFSSWDENNNGVFGEWLDNKSADDIPDLYPDICVGRLPCRNILEVKIVVKKIINYEKEKCSDSWFKRMVVVAGDTYPNREGYEGENYTEKALEMMINFTPVKLWTSDGSLKSWRDIVRAINRGCGFLYLSGHGTPIWWATHPPENEEYIFGLIRFHMFFLQNGNKLPICIVGGCHNSMFNISLHNRVWTNGIPACKCWSWALVSKINGGAIATIGPTALSYGPTDISSRKGGSDWLDMHFFESYGLKKKEILGEVWKETIKAFLQNFSINWNEKSPGDSALNAKNVEQWLLIGDPSLKIGGYSGN